jgi:hypothetical protein
MQRLVNEFVGDVRPVELCGVDVIDPGRNSTSDDGEGGRAIFRGAEYAPARELHGAEPHATDRAVGEKDGCAGHDDHLDPWPGR